MTPSRDRHWLYPPATHSANLWLARYAAHLATGEWIALTLYLSLMPTGGTRWVPCELALFSGVWSILLLAGLRGLRTGDARRLGSLILVATNAAFLTIVLLILAIDSLEASGF